MSRRRRRKKKGLGTILFLSLVIIACLVILAGLITGNPVDSAKSMVVDKITEKAAEQVMEQTIQKALESSGDSQAAAKAKEIVSNMEEQDKQAAQEMIRKYANTDTLSDITGMVSDGVNSETLSEIKDYLQENVSAEDQARLEEMYQKYSQED